MGSSSKRVLGLGVIALAGALALHFAGRRAPAPSVVEAPEQAHAPRTHHADAPFLTSPAPASEPSRRSHEGELAGPHPDDPHEPGMLPHPITPEHERIFAENRTIGALNDAMALRDVGRMRALLAEYRKLDPNDIEATQLGYSILADCIESPGRATQAEAIRFYDTQRHSPLRRFIRRICFENRD